jgi:hypothetical protein
MSFAELKSEVDRLSPEERRQLKAYLIIKDRMADPAFRQEMARKIDDKDPSHWVTLEEAEKKLGL